MTLLERVHDCRFSLTYLDLNLVESLSIVDTNHATDHLWHDNHVAEMGPHRLRLLTSRCLALLKLVKRGD